MSGADPLKTAAEHKSVVDSSLFSELVTQLAISDDSTGVSDLQLDLRSFVSFTLNSRSYYIHTYSLCQYQMKITQTVHP